MDPVTPDPLRELAEAREDARARADPLADLCFLATVDGEGVPGVRTLVLRDAGPDALALALSATSPKWAALEETDAWELLLLYRTLHRQYRVRGRRRPGSHELLERAWAEKSHGSRLLEASYDAVRPQSAPVASRAELEAGIEELRRRYPTADHVPRPPSLRAVVLVPDRIEVWRGSPEDRLHDRRLLTRTLDGPDAPGPWSEQVLVP